MMPMQRPQDAPQGQPQQQPNPYAAMLQQQMGQQRPWMGQPGGQPQINPQQFMAAQQMRQRMQQQQQPGGLPMGGGMSAGGQPQGPFPGARQQAQPGGGAYGGMLQQQLGQQRPQMPQGGLSRSAPTGMPNRGGPLR